MFTELLGFGFATRFTFNYLRWQNLNKLVIKDTTKFENLELQKIKLTQSLKFHQVKGGKEEEDWFPVMIGTIMIPIDDTSMEYTFLGNVYTGTKLDLSKVRYVTSVIETCKTSSEISSESIILPLIDKKYTEYKIKSFYRDPESIIYTVTDKSKIISLGSDPWECIDSILKLKRKMLTSCIGVGVSGFLYYSMFE